MGNYEYRRAQQNVFLLVLACSMLIAAPAVVFGWIGQRWMRSGARRLLLGAGTIIGIGLMYLVHTQLWDHLQDAGWAVVDGDRSDALQAMGWVWLLSLPASPLFSFFIEAGRPRNPETQELEAQTQKQQGIRRMRERAAQRALTAPLQVADDLVLGGAGDGDLAACVKDGYAVVPKDLLQRHLVAVGGSGMGKTETILRIVAGVARLYGWRVVFLDFKGDQETATRFSRVLRLPGKRVAVYPDQSYDGWRGGANELLNRLMEVIDYSEPYYKSVAKLMMSLACFAPQGPPRSSEELLNRLRKATLMDLYAGRPEAQDIKEIPAKDAAGVYSRYRSFFYALGDKLNGTWAFEDSEACYVRVDATALKEEGASLGRYLLEDFTQYVAYRKSPDEHVLLIVDELSAISKTNVNVDNLFERMRSFNAHIVVSAQGYAGLGEEAERMLDAAGGIILHASDKPDDLIARAGTIKVVERSVQRDTLGATGLGSLRAQETFRVNPNDAGQLGPGECFIISGRRAQWVKVRRVELAPVVMKSTSHALIAERLRARYRAGIKQPAPVEPTQDVVHLKADPDQDGEQDLPAWVK